MKFIPQFINIFIITVNGKELKCPHCGDVANTDINATFNIAKNQRTYQSTKDSDLMEENTDIPKVVIVKMPLTIELQRL